MRSDATADVTLAVAGESNNSFGASRFFHDPAVLIWTVLQIRLVANSGDSSDRSSKTISIDELSRFWIGQVRSLWRSTDWLTCPFGDQATRRFARFGELDDYARNLSPARWLMEAELWLVAAGLPEKSVADASSIIEEVHVTGIDGDAVLRRGAHLAIAGIANRLDDADRTHTEIERRAETIKRELAHRLAYGLSHEINNPLANISLRAQSLSAASQDALTKRSLDRIIDQVSRAHAMIADLMFYANPPEPLVVRFDVGERCQWVIEGLSETTERLGIEVEFFSVPSSATMIMDGDPEMIGDAVAVLVRNAIEAIGSEGAIRVTLSRAGGSQSDASQVGVLLACESPGSNPTESPCIQIEVADSGPGLTTEQAECAFDPYYSGREAGRGLGLGLCRAQRIAERHNGEVNLRPALAGCVATITFRL